MQPDLLTSPHRARRAVIVSPYSGDIERNRRYLNACLRDSLTRGESPLACHAYLPAVLDDADPRERQRGMECGHDWIEVADLVAVYADLGESRGMMADMGVAVAAGVRVEVRRLHEQFGGHDDPR